VQIGLAGVFAASPTAPGRLWFGSFPPHFSDEAD
jgi:hypothetical protein